MITLICSLLLWTGVTITLPAEAKVEGTELSIGAVAKIDELHFNAVIHESHEHDSVHLRPLALPKPRVAAPRATAGALLGDMSQFNLTGTAATLKIALPASMDGAELEVFVQIRQKDQVIAQGQIKKPAPGAGLVSKLTVELKRS